MQVIYAQVGVRLLAQGFTQVGPGTRYRWADQPLLTHPSPCIYAQLEQRVFPVAELTADSSFGYIGIRIEAESKSIVRVCLFRAALFPYTCALMPNQHTPTREHTDEHKCTHKKVTFSPFMSVVSLPRRAGRCVSQATRHCLISRLSHLKPVIAKQTEISRQSLACLSPPLSLSPSLHLLIALDGPAW